MFGWEFGRCQAWYSNSQDCYCPSSSSLLLCPPHFPADLSLFPFPFLFKGAGCVVFTLLAAWWPFHPPGIFRKEYYLCNIFRNKRKQPSSSNSWREQWSENGGRDVRWMSLGWGERQLLGGLMSVGPSLWGGGSQNISRDCQFIFHQGMSGAFLQVWGRGADWLLM